MDHNPLVVIGIVVHHTPPNSVWHLWNYQRNFELKKPGNGWLNSDKELNHLSTVS